MTLREEIQNFVAVQIWPSVNPPKSTYPISFLAQLPIVNTACTNVHPHIPALQLPPRADAPTLHCPRSTPSSCAPSFSQCSLRRSRRCSQPHPYFLGARRYSVAVCTEHHRHVPMHHPTPFFVSPVCIIALHNPLQLHFPGNHPVRPYVFYEIDFTTSDNCTAEDWKVIPLSLKRLLMLEKISLQLILSQAYIIVLRFMDMLRFNSMVPHARPMLSRLLYMTERENSRGRGSHVSTSTLLAWRRPCGMSGLHILMSLELPWLYTATRNRRSHQEASSAMQGLSVFFMRGVVERGVNRGDTTQKVSNDRCREGRNEPIK